MVFKFELITTSADDCNDFLYRVPISQYKNMVKKVIFLNTN